MFYRQTKTNALCLFSFAFLKKNNSSAKIDNSVTINLKTQKDAVDLT